MSFLVTAVLSSCSPVQERDSLSQAYEQLAHCMGDSALSYERRLHAAKMLLRGDKEVIPVLIGHLDDARIYNPDYKEISETSDADRGVPTRAITVGEQCENMLREKVYGTSRLPMKLAMVDWSEWWARNRQKSWAQIQEDASRALAEATEPK